MYLTNKTAKQEVILLSAPYQTGLEFLRLHANHDARNIPIALSQEDLQQYKEAGYETLILNEDRTTINWLETNAPDKVLIFGHDLWDSLAVIDLLKAHSTGCIYVLDAGKSGYKSKLYKAAGADYVIYTNQIKLDFLFYRRLKKGGIYE